MEEILKRIELRLEKIEESIVIIANNSKIVEKDCSKMRDHITFIEKTYEVLRTPLTYLKNYVGGTKDLPSIKDEEKS